MTSQPNPFDQAAEDAVVGAMLAAPALSVPDAARLLSPADFFNPRNAVAFDVMVKLWGRGLDVDQASLAAGMRESGFPADAGWLVECVRLSGSVEPNAETIVRERARRQVIAACADAATGARTNGLDPFAVADRLRAQLVALSAPAGKPSSDLHQLDDFIDDPESDDSEWVVPGLFRRDWRVIVVAAEGSGKSLLARQFTIATAQGTHPLAFSAMPPIRTLLVDLENPRGALAGSCKRLRVVAQHGGRYERGQAWVWHRPAGFDLRSRALRAEFEANLQLAKPDLVCIGPLYKAYMKTGSETDEQAVVEVQQCLDDLRTRFGFALFMEHHAPQSDGAGHRHMRPYGSSLWLRWPELGIGMVRVEPENEDNLTTDLKRWRGDRMGNDWPKRLVQGDQWPWVGA